MIKNGLLESLHIKHYVSMPAYKGFRAEKGDWDGTHFNEMEPEPVDFDKYSRSLFEVFLEQCHADSVQVVLVFSPMYKDAESKLLGLNELRSWLDGFNEQYGFPFLDYMFTLPISQDTSNFCNASHMNPIATDEFTKVLCNELNSDSRISARLSGTFRAQEAFEP